MADTTLVTLDIDWTNGFDETIEPETTIFVSRRGVEQRESLLVTPNRQLGFSVLTETARQSQLLETIVRKRQSQLCWVPYWRGARRLTGNVSVAGTTVPASTPHAGFVATGQAMLWRNPFRAERVTVSSFTSSQLTVSATTLAWTAGRDLVVPLRLGRLAIQSDLILQAPHLKSCPLVFDIDDTEFAEGSDNPEEPCGPLILDLMEEEWTAVPNNFTETEDPTSDDDPCGFGSPGDMHKIVGGATFPDRAPGEPLIILVPDPATCVPTSQPFHVGPWWQFDVTGLDPDSTYEVHADLSFGIWFGFNYDIGLFQPGSAGLDMPVVPDGVTSAHLVIRDTPRFDGGTTFRVAVGWALLAFFAVRDHTTFQATNVRFYGPCT